MTDDGSRLTIENGKRKTETVPLESACEHCGGLVVEGTRKCPQCGLFPVKLHRCPRCHTIAAEAESACPKCGRLFEFGGDYL